MLTKMAAVFTAFTIGIQLVVLPDTTAAVRGPNLLQREIPDAFEMYVHLPYLVAISDSNNDTIFECLSAKRTHFDPKAKEVTYVATFKGHHGTQKKHVAFNIIAGPTPNTVLFTEDEHPDVQATCEISYTNYKNCFVAIFPYLGEQCLLQVSKEVADNVPQDCIDQFADICGVVIPDYSKDLCPDDEEDF